MHVLEHTERVNQVSNTDNYCTQTRKPTCTARQGFTLVLVKTMVAPHGALGALTEMAIAVHAYLPASLGHVPTHEHRSPVTGHWSQLCV